jgi:catechol 2,3-dioxygenase-like lactoylglutathione lyase family enzyme
MSRLHHVALGARDVASTALFYRDVLRLPELARHHDAAGELRSVWLDAAGTILMIEKTVEPERRVSGVGAGPFLLAFEVTRAERGELERALEAAGAPIEARTEHTSYARDPEGNRVAVSHYP